MFSKLLPILFVIYGSSSSWGQELLVNGGFEEENICTEYKVDCAPEAWISNTNGFNNYFKDANRAHSGLHCLAIEAGHSSKPYYRTFIRSRLLCGLRTGHKYLIEFFVKSPHQILDSIGIIFTPYDFLFEKRKLQNIQPDFLIAPISGQFALDSSWQKVSMVYVAKGNESFITIANFSKRDITGNTNIDLVKNFYVFVDDVSMRPLDTNEDLCPGHATTRQEIYDQDERHQFLQRLIKEYKNDPPVVQQSYTEFIKVDTITLPDVLFAVGKAGLQEGHEEMINEFCKRLQTQRIDSIIVEGHTDNTGTFSANEKLSLERAMTVATTIRSCILQNINIVTKGFADSRPVAENVSSEGKQRNRRVEVLVFTRE